MVDQEKYYNQALELLNRCLAENNFSPIVAFVEQQVASEAPQIALLREFAEGVEQRLMFLRVHYFDVRQTVIKTFADQYGVDITDLMPAQEATRYHEIMPQQVLTHARTLRDTLSETDLGQLNDLLSRSAETTTLLHSEIQSVTALQMMLLDWVSALSADTSRRFWPKFEPALGQWTLLEQLVQ